MTHGSGTARKLEVLGGMGSRLVPSLRAMAAKDVAPVGGYGPSPALPFEGPIVVFGFDDCDGTLNDIWDHDTDGNLRLLPGSATRDTIIR